jgi:hypothetical protein
MAHGLFVTVREIHKIAILTAIATNVNTQVTLVPKENAAPGFLTNENFRKSPMTLISD